MVLFLVLIIIEMTCFVCLFIRLLSLPLPKVDAPQEQGTPLSCSLAIPLASGTEPGTLAGVC